VNVFHLYKGGMRKFSKVGNFIKCSVRLHKPESFLKKKSKSIALFVRGVFRSFKHDGSSVFFKSNACVLLKRKLVFRSKDFVIPADYNIKRKKIFYKFPGVL
jgi:ribosomal protein L14